MASLRCFHLQTPHPAALAYPSSGGYRQHDTTALFPFLILPSISLPASLFISCPVSAFLVLSHH
ncbi:hypothetical protein BDU57DRAFT_521173 [Ampelomyces quisqualis]|uniref:Uncharacterized protein n=1 Tax=Ampelomyces quisqualis TaxID=50730 RepID=A0A6A5QGS3_AMPQU|nr:hypothetical protein BDU57DRAFT_521173 [Ampelomyces quisqualis]